MEPKDKQDKEAIEEQSGVNSNLPPKVKQPEEPKKEMKNKNNNIPSSDEQDEEPIEEIQNANSNIPQKNKQAEEHIEEQNNINNSLIQKEKHDKELIGEMNVVNIGDVSKNVFCEYGSLNNEQGIVTATLKKRFNSKGLGVVIYMEKAKYKDSVEENKKIHIEITKKEIYDFIIQIIKEKKAFLKYAIIAHEHGKNLQKCHYQCCFVFSEKLGLYLKPTEIKTEKGVLLVMFQSANNPSALFEYCKKDKDYEIFGNIEKKEKNITNVYSKIINTKNLTNQDIIQIFREEGGEDDIRQFMYQGPNLLKNYENMIKLDEIPPFEWKFPEHMLAPQEDLEKQTVFQILHDWFLEECVNSDKKTRKKALFLYSRERGMGKTSFCKGLVNHPAYYIYNRFLINGDEFRKKENTGKLVILDDIKFSKSQEYIEMMKAVVAGEETDISSKYVQFHFLNGLPAIICTNNSEFFEYVCNEPAFNTQCVIVGFHFYIGPPGTRPQKYTQKKIFVTMETQKYLDEKRGREGS